MTTNATYRELGERLGGGTRRGMRSSLNMLGGTLTRRRRKRGHCAWTLRLDTAQHVDFIFPGNGLECQTLKQRASSLAFCGTERPRHPSEIKRLPKNCVILKKNCRGDSGKLAPRARSSELQEMSMRDRWTLKFRVGQEASLVDRMAGPNGR